MLDIVEVVDGKDLGMADSVVPKAFNLLQTQVGVLDYATDFGVDLKFFLDSPFQFQNQTFKAYLIERMMQFRINVIECMEVIESLYTKFTWTVGDAASKSEGLIK